MISYGNRLFCDAIGGELRHRWGSGKLYRAYYQDYGKFLDRPEEIATKAASIFEIKEFFVVHADLRQFYDRVFPKLLSESINRIRRKDDDPEFFSFAESVLSWGWHPRDEREARIYAEHTELEDFTRVALPQGLVASGFFANIVLLPFDEALRAAIGTEIDSRICLVDACRYVDDLRILISIDANSGRSLDDLEEAVSVWLSQILKENADGLILSSKKTQVAALSGDERPLVGQRRKMNRIQSAVSGGFDSLGGEEILDEIQGLMRTQRTLSVNDDNGWRLSPVPDVGDETVRRFGAVRYRNTFRSTRPLLQDDDDTLQDEDDDDTLDEFDTETGDTPQGGRLHVERVERTKRDLDKDARTFALGLVQWWIEDPANVRLLRIGLDLWPDVKLLREVLSLLRPFTEKGVRQKTPKRVAWYCLAEVLRAGATETGLVPDTESLPSDIDLKSYREELRSEAVRLVALPTIPWYLRQQALLFLAAYDPGEALIPRTGRPSETRHYRELIRFLRGEVDYLRSPNFATLAVLARRAFMDRVRAVALTRPGLNPSRKRQLAQRDPSFLLEFIDAETDSHFLDDLPARTREDLCVSSDGDHDTLAEAVLSTHPSGSFRNELSLLCFARAFLEQWRQQMSPPEVITPRQVKLDFIEDHGVAQVEDLQILGSKASASGSLYEVPAWCKAEERWRFQLGFLLRFILSGQPDFTRSVRSSHWHETESSYRPAENHWYQRLYGFFSGQSAFGDDWLPITEWMEGFLLVLLRWPGCRGAMEFDWVEQGIQEVETQIGKRMDYLKQKRGRATHALILPMQAKEPEPPVINSNRSLRACVVQTVIPTSDDLKCNGNDLGLDNATIRRKHRNHLSAALAAVKRMLVLRETHKKHEGRLDWLILPELAVHPKDVRTHLVPFARANKAMILTGLTYQKIIPGQPFVNSAIWIIPERSAAYGLQIKIRRQGKEYLAPNEQEFNSGGTIRLQGFRPCQWLIGYPWSSGKRPVWLTAAVCYDATDLGLAADLRDKSDVFAIPALNKDVKTFDKMALALHYHMFQLVVVVNNGQYGGSNAYWPKKGEFVRQVFHLHGQPQASIAFLEIDNIYEFLTRFDMSAPNAVDWKYPPAGLNMTSP